MSNHPTPEPARRRRRRLSQYDRDFLWIGTSERPRAGVSLRELLDIYLAAIGRLVDAKAAGRMTGWASFPLAADALEALAHGQALADRLMGQRWVNVRDALQYGAEVRSVARALGLDEDEVRAGLRSWAAGQAALRADTGTLGISDDEHDAVVALVDEGRP